MERTANTGWIGEGELDPTLPGISLRMEMATGLSVVRRKRDILPQGLEREREREREIRARFDLAHNVSGHELRRKILIFVDKL